MAIIQAINLTKKYAKLTAVETLNIEIDEGEVFGLLGPNGAGKTTIIKMFATLLEPTSGTAKVNGFDVVKQPAKVRESIGIVFQEPSSDELLTGYENIKLYAMMYGIPKDEIKKGISEALELVELTNRKDDLVRTYSGGMRRRLEIARSLIHKPKVLFLDEPTLGLDPAGREKMWAYISRLVEDLKMTVLLTTHYMEEADALADRIGIIDQGKIVVVDTPKALKATLGGDLVTINSSNIPISELKKLKYVKKIKQENHRVVLTIENVSRNLQPLLKFIGKIDSVEVRNTTLNDVFLSFTGKRIQEEGKSTWFDKIIQESTSKA
ncbi:ATP-binding cassette domain-containing protein [Candidatus Bathyarchaeota archaeon]|nr:ATP-binding cassette domain-containing protein [Candidatus Bathyarchaeota archaeon]